ncbi:MAG TPA: TA system VapC family ribonuclease toxin [Vicinamibacterales bacterium]|jgi:toxin-antitoxin system PIN domain toxin|nr:TA system VapC family ribonuclease toxin [Vicinamibacterales bacterium]
MVALDTNILVYAHRRDSAWHEPALRAVTELAQGHSAWAIPWPCIWEFLAIVTHPRIYNPPSPIDDALIQVERWFEAPSVHLLSEGDAFFDTLRPLVRKAKVRGPALHDARVAALCLRHGVTRLLTADRDFSRFPQLRTGNPLLGS